MPRWGNRGRSSRPGPRTRRSSPRRSWTRGCSPSCPRCGSAFRAGAAARHRPRSAPTEPARVHFTRGEEYLVGHELARLPGPRARGLRGARSAVTAGTRAASARSPQRRSGSASSFPPCCAPSIASPDATTQSIARTTGSGCPTNGRSTRDASPSWRKNQNVVSGASPSVRWRPKTIPTSGKPRDGDALTWEPEAGKLSEFLLAMLCWQAVMGGLPRTRAAVVGKPSLRSSAARSGASARSARSRRSRARARRCASRVPKKPSGGCSSPPRYAASSTASPNGSRSARVPTSGSPAEIDVLGAVRSVFGGLAPSTAWRVKGKLTFTGPAGGFAKCQPRIRNPNAVGHSGVVHRVQLHGDATGAVRRVDGPADEDVARRRRASFSSSRSSSPHHGALREELE